MKYLYCPLIVLLCFASCEKAEDIPVLAYYIDVQAVRQPGMDIEYELSGTNIDPVKNITSGQFKTAFYKKGSTQTVTLTTTHGNPMLSIDVANDFSKLYTSESIAHTEGTGTISVTFVVK